MPQNRVGDERLPAAERLRLRPDFQRVYRDGEAHRTSLIVLFVLQAPDLSRKAGFVAGRRVGGAVARNRAKRLLREAYRRHKLMVPEAGVNLVFVARNGCAEASYAHVEREVIELLTRAGGGGASDRASS